MADPETGTSLSPAGYSDEWGGKKGLLLREEKDKARVALK